MINPIDRYQSAVLQFSGGKDSIACLHLLRPWWDKITVMWSNAGDPFPETVDQMREIASMVPHFMEVTGDVLEQTSRCGWPTDVYPVSRGVVGKAIENHDKQLLQPFISCCAENVWRTMDKAVRDHGFKLVIRGQRRSDVLKAPIASGSVIDGIEYWFPIDGWSERQVFEYLLSEGVNIPEHYNKSVSSLDCMHCTAWLKEKAPTIEWMKNAYPDVHREVISRLHEIRRAVSEDLSVIDRTLEGAE